MSTAFVQELEAFGRARLAPIVGAGQTSLEGAAAGDPKQMLQIALGNEISVSELAAAWVPSTAELDVKLAFARQVGDEAGHFQLVADRLRALDFDVAGHAEAHRRVQLRLRRQGPERRRPPHVRSALPDAA
jgi:hypothetical protein